MKPILKIKYCTAWGYIDRAVSLTHVLLKEHRGAIEKVEIIPGEGGAFEIYFNDDQIFSKLESGRFPENFEIQGIISGKM